MTDEIDVEALRKASTEMRKNHGIVGPKLAQLEERFRGEMQYQYYVLLRDSQGNETPELFKNRPDRIYPNGKPGDKWPYAYYQQTDWVIVDIEQSVQQEALDAQKWIVEARQKSEGLDTISLEDVEALEDIPSRLATAITGTKSAQDFFHSGVEALALAKQGIINAHWTGDGAKAYSGSLDVQITTFTTCENNMKTLGQAQAAVGHTTLGVADALAQIYIDDVEKMAEAASEAISLASGPTSWSTYANLLLTKAKEAATRQAKNFQDTLKKLNDDLDQGHLVEQAKNLRMTSWPVPNDVITQPWD